MKKVVIGCLVVLVLGAIGVGVASYFFYRSAKSYVSSFTQMQDIPKIEEQVRNKASFTPPANGELTEAAVTRFMAVQKVIKDKLGARVTELDSKYESLNQESGDASSFGDGLGALKDLGGLIVEAKKVQVEALNQQGFSLAEYNWTRQTIYQAAGVPLSMNLDEIIRSAQSGKMPSQDSMTEAVMGAVPEKNKALVEPHAETLRENAGFAFFGL